MKLREWALPVFAILMLALTVVAATRGAYSLDGRIGRIEKELARLTAEAKELRRDLDAMRSTR